MSNANKLVGSSGDGYQRFDNDLMINSARSDDIGE